MANKKSSSVFDTLTEQIEKRVMFGKALQLIETLGSEIGVKVVVTNGTRKAALKASASANRGKAQRARWAKARAAKTAKPKRTLSTKARKAIAKAQRLRWARQKAAQKKAAK